MKRRLTLAAITVALGIVSWGLPTGVRAEETIPAAFEKAGPAVDAAPEAIEASDDGDEPSTIETAPDADAEPLADEDEPVAEKDAAEQADSPANDARAEESTAKGDDDDELPATSDPPERISNEGIETELIRERYPNRAIKVEREVTQDVDGNYVNHGSWKMWDLQGSLMVEGQYHYGQRTGVWNRWYRTADAELLKTVPYSLFHGPFISQATFDLDRLDGKWTIYDRHQHKISEWEFVDGERNGNFTWWFPTGQKMRECHFEGGELNGQLLEWGPNSRLVAQETYEHGRKLGPRIEKHRSGGNKSEGLYLFAREIVKTPDDWWNAKPAVYAKQGKDERHGHWVTWYPNGQKQSEGEYDHDVQVGQFSWWFANGQRAIQGQYSDGEQQGKWVWWHENGQKSIQGDYRQGHPVGHWTWWNQDGKVARASELEQGAGEIVQKPLRLPKPAPSAPQSASRASGAPGQPKPSTVR